MPPEGGGTINNHLLDSSWNEDAETDGSNNPNILYIAVEYVKHANDFKLEQEAEDLNSAQTYQEFQHVSPLDPNMSSVASYSPVYTSETNFENPVVVAQLVQNADNETAPPNPENIIGNQFLQIVERSSTVPNDPQIIANTEQEVDILITDQTTGISYLVERCLAEETHLLDSHTLLGTELLSLDDGTLKANLPTIISDNQQNTVVENEKTEITHSQERRSLRQTARKVKGAESEEELLTCVQQISDKPILSRARASLPENHLIIGRNLNGEIGIFAKRFIPKRTQFGPIEGLTSNDYIKYDEDQVVLSVETSDGSFLYLDVSDENSSNWMRFVQLGQNFSEQNLVLTQQDNCLYYTTIKNILPKQELLVGYGRNYAQMRNLPVLEPMLEDEWPCYECSERFTTSEQLQKHLDQHEEMDEKQIVANDNKKRKARKKQQLNMDNNVGTALQCTVCMEVFSAKRFNFLRQHLNEHGLPATEQLQDRYIIAKSYSCYECESIHLSEDDLSRHLQENHSGCSENNSSNSEQAKDEQSKEWFKCPKCNKLFASRDRIQKHMMVHGDEQAKPLQCDKCSKRFLNKSALVCHLKTHLLGGKIFECPICKESFHQVFELKLHVPKHCVDGHYTCPHCNKLFDKYSIIRKHIRAFHSERKHSCTHCSKSFQTLDKLRCHLLRHSDHREFLCADCGKQFKRKDKLKEHCKRVHSEERENAIPKKFTPKVEPTDYHRFIYKCHTCLVGFKRRGMLVNHLAKRHPDISLNSVPELNLPILRATKDYFCNYCDKVYKSSSKRKAHILKNHPGSALPLSNRRFDSTKVATDAPNPTFSMTVGSVTTHPHGCQLCHKQYASKAKLLQHQRKTHKAQMLEEEKNHDEAGGVQQQDEEEEQFYQQVIAVADIPGTSTVTTGSANDSRLYRLLTTGNNLVPPR